MIIKFDKKNKKYLVGKNHYSIEQLMELIKDGMFEQALSTDAKTTEIDNEQAFRDWMSQQKKDNGEPYSDRTINQDCSEIKNAKSKDLIKEIIPCENLFNIDEPQVIIDTKNEVVKDKEIFEQFNKSNHYCLTNGLSHYYDFLVWKHSQKTEDATNLSRKEIVEKISNYIKSKGFSYSGNLIENFYLSLKSKPFVILAGISGTGKTRLVKLFAEAIGAKYKLISVRPDWSDSSDLFGHLDLQNHFVTGELTEVIRKAKDDPERPYFVCLDEMNLARVEYYLSDFLSNIETRELQEGEIVTKTEIFTIPKHLKNDENGEEKWQDEEKLFLPNNLYIVGTVNMDETTFPFSKKVLDRANTIEFSEVDLKFEDATLEEQPVLTGITNDFLRSEYIVLKDGYNDSTKSFLDEWIGKLDIINSQLKKMDMHVGYRVRDEICFYMLNSRGIIKENEAFNTEIMQKILPRIQGSSNELRTLLINIFNSCLFESDKTKFIQDKDDDTLLKEMKESAGDSPLGNKIVAMLKRLINDGYTKFWI